MKIVKVYLTSESFEEKFKFSEATFGVLIKNDKGKYKRGGLWQNIFTVEPIDYIPDNIDYYRDVKDIKFTKNVKLIYRTDSINKK